MYLKDHRELRLSSGFTYSWILWTTHQAEWELKSIPEMVGFRHHFERVPRYINNWKIWLKYQREGKKRIYGNCLVYLVQGTQHCIPKLYCGFSLEDKFSNYHYISKKSIPSTAAQLNKLPIRHSDVKEWRPGSVKACHAGKSVSKAIVSEHLLPSPLLFFL